MFRKDNLTNMCGCDSVTDKQYKHQLNCGCDNPQPIPKHGVTQTDMLGGGDVDIESHLYPNDEQYSPFSDIDDDSPVPVYNDTYDKAINYEDVQLNNDQNQTGGGINNVNNIRRDITNRMIFDDKLVGKTIRQLKYMKSKNDYLTLFD